MSAAGNARNTGVRNPDPRQDCDLQGFHGRRLLVAVVVVADQVEKSMNRKMGDMIPQRLVLGLGFPSRRLIGDHYVAEATMTIRNDRTGRSISIFRRAMPLYARSARSAHRRKRQHICRLILAAPV